MIGPKAKRRPAKTALQTLQLLAAYHVNALLAMISGVAFWFFEQRRSRLEDCIDNKENER